MTRLETRPDDESIGAFPPTPPAPGEPGVQAAWIRA